MYSANLFVLLAFITVAHCRYVLVQEVEPFEAHLIEVDSVFDAEQNEKLDHQALRVRRQVRGSGNTNPDGSFNINARAPLAGNDKNVLSAIGGVNGLQPNGGKFGSASAGLSLDNVNGHGLSVTGKHIPNFGNQLTGAGRLNLLNTDRHRLDANAFVTKNMPKFPNVPNFNTHGGSLDYMYNNKVGASLGAAHTDLLKRTDYSASGNLNLFRNPTSSLDFSAGVSKSISPFIPKSSWQPNAGISFTKYW